MECPVEEITADWKTSGPLAESARHSARGVGGIAQADGEAPEDPKNERPQRHYSTILIRVEFLTLAPLPGIPGTSLSFSKIMPRLVQDKVA